MLIVLICVFIFGTLLGSFINALQYRIENNLSISKGRSFCPNCKKTINWYDLFPIVSWVLLRGKCRNCKKQISLQYPVIELVTATSILIYLNSIGFVNKISTLQGIINLGPLDVIKAISVVTISSILILVALHDYKTGYVLSVYVYVAIFMTFILKVLEVPSGDYSTILIYFTPYIYSVLLASTFFGGLFLFSRGKWMGGGDIEIAILMGIILGWPNIIIALYFAFVSGSVVGIYKLYRKKANRKTEMAFGPYLIAGVFFAFLFSQQIVNFYVNIILGY